MGVKDYLSKLFEEPVAAGEEEETIDSPKKPINIEEETIPMETIRNETPKNSSESFTRTTRTEGTSSSVLELKVVRPESYSSVGQIADHLLNRCTVVLNLEATEKDTARRIVDFLNGVAYSIDGQIKPVANNTFIITPKNVSISGEQLTENRGRTANTDEF
jgi:cell division inhibitor SepF